MFKKQIVVCCVLLLWAALVRAQDVIPQHLPQAKGLAVYRLEPIGPSQPLLDKLLERVGVANTYLPVGRKKGTQGVFEQDHLKAWLDSNGDMQLFPTLSKLKPIDSSDYPKIQDAAKALFTDPQFLPQDDLSDFEIVPRGAIKQAMVDASGNSSGGDAEYVSYFMAQRRIRGIPVEGPGSRALVAVGAGGVIHGVTRSWRVLRKTAELDAPMDETRVRELMQKQLSVVRSRMKAKQPMIRNAQVVYYDGNGDYVQPIIQYEIVTEQSDKLNAPAMIGRIALREGLEPLPDIFLTPASGGTLKPQPKLPQPGAPVIDPVPTLPKTINPRAPGVAPRTAGVQATAFVQAAAAAATGAPRVRVGTFLADFGTDADKWNVSAGGWLSVLGAESGEFDVARAQSLSSLVSAVDSTVSSASDTALSAEMTSDLQLALFEAHGEPWRLYTVTQFDGPVSIDQLPLPAATPSDWVLHSCSVIPSEIDMPRVTPPRGMASADVTHWYGPWLKLFGHVRSVVGYRTQMLINDDAPKQFAERLANGASLSVWFQVLAANNTKVHSRKGRGSAVFLCGQEDATVQTPVVAPSTDPPCLVNIWMADCAAGSCPTDTDDDQTP